MRNVRPSFHTSLGLYGGLVGSGFSIFLGGREPWTLSHGAPDYKQLKPINECKPIDYPKPDNKITFDLLSSVALTGTNHEGINPLKSFSFRIIRQNLQKKLQKQRKLK